MKKRAIPLSINQCLWELVRYYGERVNISPKRGAREYEFRDEKKRLLVTAKMSRTRNWFSVYFHDKHCYLVVKERDRPYDVQRESGSEWKNVVRNHLMEPRQMTFGFYEEYSIDSKNRLTTLKM